MKSWIKRYVLRWALKEAPKYKDHYDDEATAVVLEWLRDAVAKTSTPLDDEVLFMFEDQVPVLVDKLTDKLVDKALAKLRDQ